MSKFNFIYAEDLSHREKTVYISLRDRADASGVCWPGIKTIAGELGLSPRTVQRALADLEHRQLIEKRQRHRANGSLTGLGENQPHLRYSVCRGRKYLGVRIDGELNDQMVSGKEGKISAFDSHVPVYVINTNEELVIARDTKTIVEKLEYASTEDKTVVDLEDI